MEFIIPSDVEQKKNTTTFNLPSGYDAEMAEFNAKTGNEKGDRDRLPTVPANKNKEEATKNDDKPDGTGETIELEEDPNHTLQFAMDMGGRRKRRKKKSKTKKKKKGRKKRGGAEDMWKFYYLKKTEQSPDVLNRDDLTADKADEYCIKVGDFGCNINTGECYKTMQQVPFAGRSLLGMEASNEARFAALMRGGRRKKRKSKTKKKKRKPRRKSRKRRRKRKTKRKFRNQRGCKR